MMEDVLLAEVLLRRNYQDLQFCPQDKQEDMEKSRSRGLSKAGAMLPGSVTYDAKGLLKGNLPYLQELLLPSDFRRLNEAALVVSEQAQQAIAVNMDEHLVLKSWGGAEQVEELIEKTRLGESQVQDDNHPFAQDAQFGFLSYRPQLAGSGLHVSLVLHLPMLHFLKQIRSLMEELQQKGCSLKPLSLLDGRNPAKLFLLSNQTSFNRSDAQIKQSVMDGTQLILGKEKMLRDKAITPDGASTVLDQVWRSYGVLKYARRLNSTDFLTHWSNLRLGAQTGQLPLTLQQVDDLLNFANDNAFLMEESDFKQFVNRRAEEVRRALSGG